MYYVVVELPIVIAVIAGWIPFWLGAVLFILAPFLIMRITAIFVAVSAPAASAPSISRIPSKIDYFNLRRALKQSDYYVDGSGLVYKDEVVFWANTETSLADIETSAYSEDIETSKRWVSAIYVYDKSIDKYLSNLFGLDYFDVRVDSTEATDEDSEPWDTFLKKVLAIMSERYPAEHNEFMGKPHYGNLLSYWDVHMSAQQAANLLANVIQKYGIEVFWPKGDTENTG